MKIRDIEYEGDNNNIYYYHLLSTVLNNVMIKKAPETGEWVCGVGVGVRRGLRGASVPRWSA